MLGRTAVMLAAGEYADVILLVGRILSGIERGSVTDEELATRLHLTAHQQLGSAHAATGDLAGAVRHFDLADDLARRLGDRYEVAQVALRRGRVLVADGLVHQALELLCDARQQALQEGAAHAAAAAVVPIAEALAAAGSPVSAMELLERIGPTLEQLGCGVAERDRALAEALLSAGLAEEAYERGLAARDAFRDAGRMAACARAELVCAAAALRLGRADTARHALVAAEQLATACGDVLSRDEARLLLARIACTEGSGDAAVLQLGRVLQDESVADTARVRATLLMAQALRDPQEAEARIAVASAEVDRLGRPELRLELRIVRARRLRQAGSTRQAAEELRAACAMAHLLTQRPRAGGGHGGLLAEASDELIDLLVEDGGHAALIEAWQRVRAAKASAFSALRAHTHGWHVDEAAVSAIDVDSLIAGARRGLTAGGQVATPDLPPVPEGPVVEYYVTGADVIAFVLREGQVHVRRLGGAAPETARLVSAWQQECHLVAVLGSGAAASPSLDALYDHLVLPLADLLADIELEPLEVAAHRHLLGVPFDALLDVGASWRRQLTPPELAAPMPAEPAEPAESAAAGELRVLVLAAPDEQAPAIAAEAEMIAATLPRSEVRVGATATADALAGRIGSADLVHVAAHGRFHAGNPLFSALRLADGWLTAAELVDGRFDLRGRVIVLSACGSGRAAGHLLRPIGLAWACLSAGADGVVASLWPVDDEVTVTLMTHFYERIAAGDSPRTALGRARHAVARTHPHPYHWAAFRYFTPAA
ncbi:CHAT domain-containing protein [Nocardioides humi]|uniref:CHAT domain-containing protein n=1 Tax=Nocardioides humi TaxID=449461 RepID=UPI00112D9BB2|nr:CHAT domain-containing protein [Nocardioides humi]